MLFLNLRKIKSYFVWLVLKWKQYTSPTIIINRCLFQWWLLHLTQIPYHSANSLHLEIGNNRRKLNLENMLDGVWIFAMVTILLFRQMWYFLLQINIESVQKFSIIFAADRFTLFKVINVNVTACIPTDCSHDLVGWHRPTLAFFGARSHGKPNFLIIPWTLTWYDESMFRLR